MVTPKETDRCPLCGEYLSISEEYIGYSCVDPSHWLAAGRLAPQDFYAMAQVAARATLQVCKLVRAMPTIPSIHVSSQG